MRGPALFLALAMAPLIGHAETCQDRLLRHLTTPPFEGAGYSLLIESRGGGVVTKAERRFESPFRSVTITITPPGQPQTLRYDGSSFEADGAGGWRLLAEGSLAQVQEARKAQDEETASAILSARCSTEFQGAKMYIATRGKIGPVAGFPNGYEIAYFHDQKTHDPAFSQMRIASDDIAFDLTITYARLPGFRVPAP